MKVIIGVNLNDLKTEIIKSESGKKFIGNPYSEFIAPSNEKTGEYSAIIGRMHVGDENGVTEYYYGTLSVLNLTKFQEKFPKAGDLKIVIRNKYKTEAQRESDSAFSCADGEVFTGRHHEGDENGGTWMQIGEVYLINGGNSYRVSKQVPGYFYDVQHESDGTSATRAIKIFDEDGDPIKAYSLMTARVHNGDENGFTKYEFHFFEFDTDDMEILEDTEEPENPENPENPETPEE